MRIQWLRSIAEKAGLIGAALLTVTVLTSCGGGGATSTTAATTGALLVLPSEATVFPNTPVTYTVSGGSPGYAVFSGNSTVIPLNSQVTNGNFSVVANDVDADTPVVITVRDAVNATAITTANVKVAVLNNQVTLKPFAPTDQPENLGCLPTNVCSGGEANVTVTATKNNIKLINRPIQFSVYQGKFQFVTPNSLSLVNSLTVNTDESGLAVAKLAVPAGAPTQVATLTIKDTTTGLLRYFNFNILQQFSGLGILSSLPSGNTTFTGAPGPSGFSPAADGTCPTGFVDYYIFGGTPPYRIASPLPQLVLVAAPGLPFAAETILTINGGSIVAQIFGCGQTQLIVTDATNRTIETSQIIGVRGPAGVAGAPPPATVAPTVNPASINLTACTGLGSAVTVVIGGTTPTVANIPTLGGNLAISVVNGGASATITRISPSIGVPVTPISVTFSNAAGTATLTVNLVGAAAAACP